MKIELAPDVQDKIHLIVKVLEEEFGHIDATKVTAIRSYKTRTNAIARIWELPKVWQLALVLDPHYVIEVISERYDKLPEPEKDKTLIHELLHIPKTFSGALVPHRCFGKVRVGERQVKKLYERYSMLVEGSFSIV